MEQGIKHGMMPVREILSNSQNPRIIKDKAYQKLKSSIRNFPEMLYIRPIVIDEQNIVIGGNMRLAVVKDLGWETVPVVFAQTLTKSQKKEFIIKDNIQAGEWDYLQLSTWTDIDFSEWGIDLPVFRKTEIETHKINTYEKIHILISFAPEKLMDIDEYLIKIKNTEGIEYEQSAN